MTGTLIGVYGAKILCEITCLDISWSVNIGALGNDNLFLLIYPTDDDTKC